jgi:hypothetical protein
LWITPQQVWRIPMLSYQVAIMLASAVKWWPLTITRCSRKDIWVPSHQLFMGMVFPRPLEWDTFLSNSKTMKALLPWVWCTWHNKICLNKLSGLGLPLMLCIGNKIYIKTMPISIILITHRLTTCLNALTILLRFHNPYRPLQARHL